MTSVRTALLPRLAAVLLACTTAAACSGSGIVAPTTANNATLLQQFATLKAQADSSGNGAQSNEDLFVIQMLSLGAPVNQLTVTLDGTRVGISATAALVVLTDTLGNPVDSAYTFIGWRGASADTMVLMQYAMSAGFLTRRASASGIDLRRVFAPPPAPGISASISPIVLTPQATSGLLIGQDEWIAYSDSASASFQQTHTGGTCPTFTSPIPLNTPPNVSCEPQRATVSFDATASASGGAATGSHHVSLPASGVSGVRLMLLP